MMRVAAATLLLVSCGLLGTREPEEPGTTTVPVFIQPDRPQDVIRNLQNAVASMNTDHYMRSLATEAFEFRPAGAAMAENPELWQGWGLDEERFYFNNMRAETEGRSGHRLRLADEAYVPVPPNRQQYEASYEITVRHNRSGVPETAKGLMRLDMEQSEDGLWFIRSWTDAPGSGDFTWSDFKARFF